MKRKLAVLMAAVMMIAILPSMATAGGFLETYRERIKKFGSINLLLSEDSIWDFEGEDLMSIVGWEMLALDEDSAIAYPQLAAALEAINLQQTECMTETSREMGVQAREIYADTGRTESCSANLHYYVQRADHQVLSFRSDNDVYWGGAHPDYGTIGMNFDVKTGEAIELSDVVNEPTDLIRLLARRMEEKYTDLPIEDMESTLLALDEQAFEWTLGWEGITFYFNPYVILPYASGKTTATIRYDEAAEMFNPAYVPVKQRAYAVQIPAYEEIEWDLDFADGKNDLLAIYPQPGEYDGYEKINIMINGEAYPFDMFSYSFDAFLVKMLETQKSFLYIETIETDGYASLHVYDLNGGKPELVTQLWGSGFEGGAYADKAVFIHPERFVLESRLEIIGTRFASRLYSVDENSGIPVPEQEYFELDETGRPLTALIPLTVLMLDTDTEETLPAGTECCPIRTDGETYMDFRLDDGRECRVQVDQSEYPARINGIDEDECFDGFIYAG